MELATLEKEIAGWPPEKQDQLASFLANLRLRRDPEYLKELENLLDDRSPDKWVSLDEMNKMFS